MAAHQQHAKEHRNWELSDRALRNMDQEWDDVSTDTGRREPNRPLTFPRKRLGMERNRCRMTRRIVCLLTLLTATAGATELIGLTVPPYPDDLTNKQGACIAQSRGLDNECDYSMPFSKARMRSPV
jgi:hypothetical protein